MTTAKLRTLLKEIEGLTDDELVEFQKLITHVLGQRRSLQVLSGELQRPGRRGRRWKRLDTKGTPK